MIPVPLSYSAISTFQNCPYRFYAQKIADVIPLKETPNEAATWGQALHKALEDHLREGKPIPGEYETYEQYARRLASLSGRKFVEHKLAINRQREPVDFFASDVYIRGVLDYLVIQGSRALLIDHKTGKVRPTKQLHYNAVLIFAAFPEVDEIKAHFYWCKYGTSTGYTFLRTELHDLWRMLSAELTAIDEAYDTGYWPKTPSGLCGWCPVVGCEHYKERSDAY